MYQYIMQNGQIIAFFAQLIYWFGLLVLLGYAVFQYKRWVNFQLGTGRSGQLRHEGPADKAEVSSDPNVDEFVD